MKIWMNNWLDSQFLTLKCWIKAIFFEEHFVYPVFSSIQPCLFKMRGQVKTYHLLYWLVVEQKVYKYNDHFFLIPSTRDVKKLCKKQSWRRI